MRYRVKEALNRYGECVGYYVQRSWLGLIWSTKQTYGYECKVPLLFPVESQAVGSIAEERLHRCRKKRARGKRAKVVYEDTRRNPCEDGGRHE